SAQLWLATANSTTRVGVPTQPCSGSSSVVSLVSSVSPVSLVSSSPPIAVVPGPHASSHEARVEYSPVRSSRLTRPHGRMDPGQPRIGTNSPGIARKRPLHRQTSLSMLTLHALECPRPRLRSRCDPHAPLPRPRGTRQRLAIQGARRVDRVDH